MLRGKCAPRAKTMRWRGSTTYTSCWTMTIAVLAQCGLLGLPVLSAPARPGTDVRVADVNAGQPVPVCGDREEQSTTDKLTYSLIVVAYYGRVSTLLDDPARMCAYTEGTVYVQTAQLGVTHDFNLTAAVRGGGGSGVGAPFGVEHVAGADRRVTVVDLLNNNLKRELTLTWSQVSHLKAACEDPSVRTVLMSTDETCKYTPLSNHLPASCWTNIVRHYPINAESRWTEMRIPYIPLGARNTFPFVDPEAIVLATDRKIFYNLQLGEHTTAPRRVRLIQIARDYGLDHVEQNAHVMGPNLDGNEYQKLLLNSTFTICPGGHNPESHRMFEALEAGSIPIVSRQDFLYPSFKPPFPCGEGQASWNTVAGSPFAMAASVASWEELPQVLDRLRSESPAVIQKLQADSVAWYEALMKRSYASILNFGEGYELWPQDGPILLSGFPAPRQNPAYTPPYSVSELEAGGNQ